MSAVLSSYQSLSNRNQNAAAAGKNVLISLILKKKNNTLSINRLKGTTHFPQLNILKSNPGFNYHLR